MFLFKFDFIISLMLFLLIVGCAPYCRNDTHIPEYPYQTLQNAVDDTKDNENFTLGDWPDEAWWTKLPDSQLRDLIERALANNPTVKIADVKIWLDNAEAKITAAALYPSLGLGADSMRTKVSHTGVFAKADPRIFPFNYTQTEMFLDFSFEIDWWGKNRSALQAALGEVQARVAEAAAVRLAVSVNVARAYFKWQSALAQVKVDQRMVENQENALILLRQLVGNGLESDLTVQKKQREVSSAKDRVLATEQELVTAKNRLNMLIADGFLDEFDETDVSAYVKAPFELPCDLSMDLIAHRPEIVAQIWRVEAGLHEVDVAEKLFYPDLKLKALEGFQTIHLGKLFKHESIYGAWGPAIHLPIFEGGRLRANLEATEYDYDLAVLQYEEMVLTAVREVLDAIDNIKLLNARYKETQEAATSAETTYLLTKDRFQHNLSSQLDVLTAERELLIVLEGRAVILGYLSEAYLALVKALGGGYIKGECCG